MNNKEKFTNKVDNYVKYRPSYPCAVFDYLENEVGLSKASVVADIGAGTGILTKLLAGRVKKMFAVEPNLNMRTACIKYCSDFDNVIAVDGSAEETAIEDKTIDFITAAQAFHWFDKDKAKIEFQRILKVNGKVILIWNSRVAESDLVKANDELLRELCPEFKGFLGGSDVSPEAFSDFFKGGRCDYRVFDNNMLLDLESFIRGSLSSSYAPLEKDHNYKAFIDALTRLFNKYNENGILLLPNKTRCYVGEV